MYKPPFTITNKMLSLCISITEKVSRINNYQSLKRMPILIKNNNFVIIQVHFEKIWQIEFGKITLSKRIKDYIRSFERAVFFLYIEK